MYILEQNIYVKYTVINIDYFVDESFGVAAYEVTWSPRSPTSPTLPPRTSHHP
jgi:hypothetical protein